MKNIFFTIIYCGLISNGSFAQLTEVLSSFGNINTNKKELLVKPQVPSIKAPGIEIWNNSFDVQSDWIINNNGQMGGAFGWSIDSVSDGWYLTSGINSDSGGNFAELSNGNPTASPGTQALGVTYTMTTATPIDIPNLPLNTIFTDQVTLVYQEAGARFNDIQEVQISTDGINWLTIRNNLGYSVLTSTGGNAYANPEDVSINLGPYITGNASSLWIRFSWTTNFPSILPGDPNYQNVWATYGWYIDDVKLFTNSDNDLEATEPYWGTEQLHYYQIPTTQVAPIDFSVNAYNNGITTQSNAILTVEVNAGTSFYGFSAQGINIASNTYDSLFLTTPFVPTGTNASYNIAWWLSQDQVDDVPSNNTLSNISFEVTDHTYARDNGVVDGSQYNNGSGFEVGNLYDIWSDQEVRGVDFMLSGATNVGAFVSAKIYSIDSQGSFILEEQTDYHEVVASDLNSIITLELLNPLLLTSSLQTYLAVVATDGDGGVSDDIVVSTAGSSDPQTSFYFNATDDTWYYTTRTPVVRLNFNPILGLDEGNDLDFKIYPNPSANNITIDYNLPTAHNVTLELIDIAGNLIHSEIIDAQNNGFNSTSVTTNGLDKGLYYVKVIAAGATVTKPFMKQ